MSRTRVAVLASSGLLVALFGGRWLAARYTEAVWFADLGSSSQFWHVTGGRLLSQALTMAIATLWYACNALIVVSSIGAVHLPRRVGNLEIAEAVPRGVLRGSAGGVAVLLGAATVLALGDIGDLVTLYRGAAPLGLPEPVLGRDVSFYLAKLPLIETLDLAAAIAVAAALLPSAGLYALTGSLVVRLRGASATPHARAHLVVLLALLALVVAGGFQVDAFRIVGGGGSLGGALSAADRTLRVPSCALLAGLGLMLAAVTTLWLRWGRAATLAGVWGAFALLAVAMRFAVPLAREKLGGPPQPTTAAAMADLASRYSRAGLGVAGVRAEVLLAQAEADGRTLEALRRSLSGFSPWAVEPDVLMAWLSSEARGGDRPRLWTATVSARRTRDGAFRLEALAVPETDLAALLQSPQRPGWDSLHRGAVAWGGDPLVVDLGSEYGAGPGAGAADAPAFAPLDVGPVRFLARRAELAVVGENGRRAGEPLAGLALRGLARRVALAWALQAPPLLDRRRAGERALYWRGMPDRLEKLYPFALFGAPRAVATGGRLVWVAPGFLASDRFPLAEQVEWQGRRVNFLCAPYVATVDAASGATRLYLRAPGSGFAARLAAASGAAVLPEDSVPPAVRDQLDYPQSLLAVQARVLARHRDRPGEREWAVVRLPGQSGAAGDLQPDAVEAALDLAGTEGLWRLVPLTDAGGNRLVGFVGATASGSGAPAPRLFLLPSTDFPTPEAVQSRLGASPAVVRAIAAAAGPEGAVRRSPVVALPVAGTVVYAQVIFASQRRPVEPLRVRSVALVAGGRVGVGSDVPAAATALASARAAVLGEAIADTSLAAARDAFLALDSAAQRGDWPAFGRAMEALREALGVVRPRRRT